MWISGYPTMVDPLRLATQGTFTFTMTTIAVATEKHADIHSKQSVCDCTVSKKEEGCLPFSEINGIWQPSLTVTSCKRSSYQFLFEQV